MNPHRHRLSHIRGMQRHNGDNDNDDDDEDDNDDDADDDDDDDGDDGNDDEYRTLPSLSLQLYRKSC